MTNAIILLGFLSSVSFADPSENKASFELYISHPNAPSKKPKQFKHRIFINDDTFWSIYSVKPIPVGKNWKTTKSGDSTFYEIDAKNGKRLRVVTVGKGVIDEGRIEFYAFMMEFINGSWIKDKDLVLGGKTVIFEPIGDLDDDGFPEFLRVEASVPCTGGDWASVVSVYPKPETVTAMKALRRPCN